MQSVNRNLLIVDDEAQIRNSLKRLFKDKGYSITTSENGKEALEIIDNLHSDNQFGVVLSDYHMVGMKGTELLAEVKKFSPETVRILLTGQSCSVSINSAVNDGALHKFLEKPWNNKDLIDTVEDAFTQYELIKENKRLAAELAAANVELVSTNKKLENEVVTKARELIQKIYYDELTGLPSLTLLKDRLNQAIKLAKRNSESISVIYLNVDNLSALNQSLGQEKSDNLVLAIANRLSKSMRASDSIARVDADRFCLVFPNDSIEKPTIVAERILNAAKAPFILGNQTFLVSASVGISLYPVDGDNVEELMRHAESAMRQVQNKEQTDYRFYSKEFSDKAKNQHNIELDIKRAVKNKEFSIFYQPRINTHKNKITSVEALVRWQHPEKGILLPQEFLPLLEDTGLINQVGDWLINQSFETLKNWQYQGINDVNMSINISTRQFYQGDLLETVQDAIQKTGINMHSSKVEFEFTEGLLIEDVNLAKKMLDELRQLGALVSIDDFGTGYSSLSYLSKFNADYIKIDRSFIADLPRSTNAKKFIKAIISLAHSLDIEVIAEGVENVEQLNMLTTMNCSEHQGFLFSKPLPEDKLLKLLQQKTDQLILQG